MTGSMRLLLPRLTPRLTKSSITSLATSAYTHTERNMESDSVARACVLFFVLLTLCLPVRFLVAEEKPADKSVYDDIDSIRISDDPQLLVSVYPEQALSTGIYEQSQLVLTIRVASKYPFDALHLEFPPIAGVEQVELARPRTRKITSYAGDGFLHERRYALFAQGPGTLKIPSATVEGLVATGVDSQIQFKDEFAGYQIEVKAKPAGYNDEWWLASSNVAIEESWSAPLAELRERDVVTRTITLRVADVDGKRLPDLVHGKASGVSVTELSTTRDTIKSSRGLTGVLTKSWSLRIENHDVVYISPIGLAYWDTAQEKRSTAAARGHRIEPLAIDSEAIASRLIDQSLAKHRTAYTLSIGLLVLLLLPVLGMAIYGFFKVYSFSHDRLLGRLFLKADSEQSAYRAWLDWSASEPCHQSEQWRSLNRNIQHAVFSRPDASTVQSGLDRRKLVRQALACARRHRFHNLSGKTTRVYAFLFGVRNEL